MTTPINVPEVYSSLTVMYVCRKLCLNVDVPGIQLLLVGMDISTPEVCSCVVSSWQNSFQSPFYLIQIDSMIGTQICWVILCRGSFNYYTVAGGIQDVQC